MKVLSPDTGEESGLCDECKEEVASRIVVGNQTALCMTCARDTYLTLASAMGKNVRVKETSNEK